MVFNAETAREETLMIEADNKIEAFEVARQVAGVMNDITMLRPARENEIRAFEENGGKVIDALDLQ